MKLTSVVATLIVVLVALTAQVPTAESQTPAAAQPPAAQPPPATQPPPPAEQPPPVDQPPTLLPQPVPAPARLPFPQDAKYAYIDLQRVANESRDGQLANQRVQELGEAKVKVLEGRNIELQASQQKLQQNANVMSAEAQLQLQREIERLSVEIQRLTQDAETEVGELQQTLQLEFQQKLVPAIDSVAARLGLHFVFSGDGGLIWANPALDITADVVDELDRASQQTP
jgi:Skp family chaperone for outer membrane proteins